MGPFVIEICSQLASSTYMYKNIKMSILQDQVSDERFRIIGFSGFTLRERLQTHKVFTKDQCFYLNYHKFSIKSYVVDVY